MATAIRETAEETGIFPSTIYEFGADISHIDGRSRIEAFVALASDKDVVELNYEHSEYRWLSADEAIAIVLNPSHIIRLRNYFMDADSGQPSLRIPVQD